MPISRNRRIVVFTGTRAEYGLLRGLLALLAAPRADLHLLVSGAHLEPRYGHTVDEIRRDDLAPAHLVDIALVDDTPRGVCRSMGKAMEGYGRVLDELRPDVMVILGDRYEAFCAGAAATVQRVPLAHLHGGELTRGAMDEVFRHGLTKMSHLHFSSCEAYRRRIIQLGEHPERVWNVGALGVENAKKVPLLSEAEIRAVLDIPAGRPYLVATWHPETLDPQSGENRLAAILDALAAFPDLTTVFTGANADMGGSRLNDLLRSRAAADPSLRFVASLGLVRYLSAARYAAGVVGNSSSGVVEIPGLGVPVLDIGSRQLGRERSRAVLHCEPETPAVRQALERLLSESCRHEARTLPNPYDKPGTATAIADVLLSFPLTNILMKEFYDAPSD